MARAVFVLCLALLCCAAVHAAPEHNDTICDPLVPQYCLYPFPNSFFLAVDPSTATGYRLNLSEAAMPRSKVAGPVRPGDWNRRDGFPLLTPLLAHLLDVDAFQSGLADWFDIAQSLSPDAPSALLDVATGQLLPHWVELDARAEFKVHQSIMMYPAAPLNPNRQYIVAYRNMKSSNGAPVIPSAAFSDLRDGLPNANITAARRAHFETLFTALAKAGFARSSLTLAWDFHTESEQDTYSQLLDMRADATNRMPTSGPRYFITNITDNWSDLMFRKILGTMEVPLYLKTELPVIDSRLVLNASGVPQFQGFANFSFEILIPRSLYMNKTRGRTLQYGHGMWYDFEEVEEGYLQTFCNNNGYVIGGVNWLGLYQSDIPTVIEIVAVDMSGFGYIPDRLAQSIINHIYLEKLFASETFVSDPAMMPSGVPLVNTTEHYYNGNSAGGIMGSVLSALSTNVKRSLLGVAGGSYSLMLLRSADFTRFWDALWVTYQSEEDVLTLLVLMQILWDRCGPGTYMGRISQNPLPNTPAKPVVIHYALGDSCVPWLAGETMGRAANAVMFPNNVRERNETLFGFPVVQGSTQGPAVIVGWDYGAPLVPWGDLPPNATTNTHEFPRRDPKAQAQMAQFFLDGTIVDVCDGQGCHDQKPNW